MDQNKSVCFTEQSTCVLFNDEIRIDIEQAPIAFLFVPVLAFHHIYDETCACPVEASKFRSNRSVLSTVMNDIVRVCTFNLRRDDVDNGTPNEWSKRRPIVRDCLERIQPAILGTQEGYPEQLNDILEDLNQ